MDVEVIIANKTNRIDKRIKGVPWENQSWQKMKVQVIAMVKLQMMKADPQKETKKELISYEEY